MNNNECLYNVSRLNNLGASFLQTENFPEAISCFSDALKLTKATATRMKQDPIVPNKNDGINMRFTLDHCMELSNCNSNLPSKGGHDGDDNGTSSFVFFRPIFMPEHPVAHLVIPERLGELSAIIVFNLALAYQVLSAMRSLPSGCSKIDSSQLLQKAIAMYDLCCQLVSSQPENDGGGEDTLYTLAVSNNLVHAHHALEQYDMANRYSQFLLSFLLARSVSGCDDGITNDAAEFFLGTVVHLMLQSNAPASAA